MAFARDSYSATAAQTDFTITFPYLLAAHVVVTSEGSVLTNAAGAGNYTIVSTTTVRLGTGATSGDRVVVTRATSQATALVDFTVPSTLVEADLDDNATQMLYMSQESLDVANASITLNTNDIFDAGSVRITALGAPTADSDAVTKTYADAISAAAGNVPTPSNPGDDNKTLTASGGTFAWNTLALTGGGTGGVNASQARTNLVVPGTAIENTFTETQIWFKGTDAVSDATQDIGPGNYFFFIGATPTTAIYTVGIGVVLKFHFDAALTLTHHATDLILPGGVNILTSAGDEAEFIEFASGDWRMLNYQYGDKETTGLTMGTNQTASAGDATFADFTGIPSWARRITIMLDFIGTDGTEQLMLQLGDAGGLETSGYDGGVSNDSGASSLKNGTSFYLNAATVGTESTYGVVTLTSKLPSSNTWAMHAILKIDGTTIGSQAAGVKSLTQPLTQFRISTDGTPDDFDSGTINIMYE